MLFSSSFLVGMEEVLSFSFYLIRGSGLHLPYFVFLLLYSLLLGRLLFLCLFYDPFKRLSRLFIFLYLPSFNFVQGWHLFSVYATIVIDSLCLSYLSRDLSLYSSLEAIVLSYYTTCNA